MKSNKRILLGLCVALLAGSWIVAMNAKSNLEKQTELMSQAEAFMGDKIYIRAVPLLEEAAGYDTNRTAEAEKKLKSVYRNLFDQIGYRGKYTSLLESEMNRKNAQPSVFKEAAQYYFGISRPSEALTILKKGIEKSEDQGLSDMYEASRYLYETSRTSYEGAMPVFNGVAAVQQGGLWGISGADGTLLVPCKYDKVSTYSNSRAIVKDGKEIYAIDLNDNRVAYLHEAVTDFGNYAEDRMAVFTKGKWKRANGEFSVGSMTFERIGTYSDGYVAAKTEGKWGVIDIDDKWLVPAKYDAVMQDEIGRCYAQDAVFVKKGSKVLLLVDGKQVGGTYEDARPFADGYAAVKMKGKWGFIDTSGEVMIPCKYEDALSYGQHLAAVKRGDLWGYISISGKIAIKPVFFEATSFSNGSAAVLNEEGWQFITLVEYKEEAGL